MKKACVNCKNTIDVGAGFGMMSLSYILSFRGNILSLAYSEDEFSQMTEFFSLLNLHSQINVGRADVMYLDSIPDQYFDQALLIDVMEHVNDDVQAIRALRRKLRYKGRLVISVPTVHHQYYFGEEYNKRIGHKRLYSLNSLQALLEGNGFKVVDYQMYTKHLEAVLCSIWYQKIKSPYVKGFLMPFLNYLSILFGKLESKVSASLIIVAEKV